MSQYFAKLLVVCGDDIKDGDYYLFDGKINKCYKSIIPDLKQFYGEEWDNNWYQKVKLFICTRENIEKGDKIRIDSEPFVEYECLALCSGGGIWHYMIDHDTYVPREKCFKVIGDVSPDATWVREGNQFNEEDIKTILKTA